MNKKDLPKHHQQRLAQMHNVIAVNLESMEQQIKQMKNLLFGTDILTHTNLYDDNFYRTPGVENSHLGGKKLGYVYYSLGEGLERTARSISDAAITYNAFTEVHFGYEGLVEKQNEKNSAPTTKRRSNKKAANKKTS